METKDNKTVLKVTVLIISTLTVSYLNLAPN